MTSFILLKTSFFIMIPIIILGAYLKIIHANGAGTFLLIGIFAALTFILTALYEIYASKRLTVTEKLLWTIGFVLMSGVVGLFYLIIGRRNIVSK